MDNVELNHQFRKNLLSEDGSKCLSYIQNRQISLNVVKDFHLGWCPTGFHPELGGRLTVPLWNIHGEIEGFAGRFPTYSDSFGDIRSLYDDELIEKRGEKTIRYKPVWWHQSFNKKYYLYGFKNSLPYIRKEGYAIIVEGEFDLWSCYQFGLKNVVAVLCSNLNLIQAARLQGIGCRKIFLMFDSDPAGEQGASKAIKSLEKFDLDVLKISLPPMTDPADYVLKYGVGSIKNTLYSLGI